MSVRSGAVNGRTAEGGQLFSDKGDEVWAGTAYGFASHCILEGLTEQGLSTAYGVYHAAYSPYGLGFFFKMPEAYCYPEEPRWNDRPAPTARMPSAPRNTCSPERSGRSRKLCG